MNEGSYLVVEPLHILYVYAKPKYYLKSEMLKSKLRNHLNTRISEIN